jgi:hypothetical protein
MAVPNIFANVTTSIPLSQLDTNFATAIVLGNTSVYLGNTTTTLGNVTLANANVTTAITLTGASGTSGQVLTSGGSGAAPTWTTPSAGKVLQVVNGTYTGQTSTTGSTYITTGLTASITPTSSTSKILSIVTTSVRFTSTSWMGLLLYRGGSSIVNLSAGLGYNMGSTGTQQFTANYLDSPATTSSTTYTLYFSNQNSPTGTVTVQQDSCTATITLIEVAP